jgi:hypothetical protein
VVLHSESVWPGAVGDREALKRWLRNNKDSVNVTAVRPSPAISFQAVIASSSSSYFPVMRCPLPKCWHSCIYADSYALLIDYRLSSETQYHTETQEENKDCDGSIWRVRQSARCVFSPSPQPPHTDTPTLVCGMLPSYTLFTQSRFRFDVLMAKCLAREKTSHGNEFYAF